jgi:hypothetical protein
MFENTCIELERIVDYLQNASTWKDLNQYLSDSESIYSERLYIFCNEYMDNYQRLNKSEA